MGDARVDFADDEVGFGHDAVKAGDGKEALVGAVVLFADDKERRLHVFGGNGDGEVVRVGFVGGDDGLGAVNARFAQGDGFGADAADLAGRGRQVGVDDGAVHAFVVKVAFQGFAEGVVAADDPVPHRWLRR